jgi:intraflagellar transport protein 122
LPLVEFILEEDISDEEAMRLIESSAEKKYNRDPGWKEETHQDRDVQVLRMDEPSLDPFTAPIMNFDASIGNNLYISKWSLIFMIIFTSFITS